MTRPRGSLCIAACLVVLSAILALTTPAGAETPLEQAKALVGRATVEYNIGHFDQALELYSKAYEALPTPALLFDLGQCHRMLANPERAIFFFQGYLREKPDASNRALVERLLLELQQQLDAQRAAERQRTPPPAPPPAEPVAPVVVEPAPAPAMANPPAPAGRPVLRIAGLVTGGTGVALIGVGIALGLHASSLSNEITQLSSRHGAWSPQYQSDYDAGKTAATAATILFVAGGLAVVTGGVLAYLGWPRSASEGRPVAMFTPTPGGASFLVTGGF
jgi:tetratricopeptide (TPR) repeat protein